MTKQDFIDSVNEIGALTPSEKLIVNYCLKNFPMLPFAKMDELCKNIGVGKATLGRFLNRLGFTGFIQFKKIVSQDLVQELTTPIERCYSADSTHPKQGLVNQHFEEVMTNMEETYNTLYLPDVERAVEYLLTPKGKLYIMGSASAEALSNYFYLLARYLRKDVVLLKADASTLPHQLVDVDKNDTLLAISYHRFSSITVRCVRWFAQHGGKIITLTDQQVNPFVSYSDIEFCVASHSESIFNNRTAGFSLIELLIKGMSSNAEKDQRFSRIENTFKEFEIFNNK
ncbi:TPA: MurR/RpiR family transcriptional regulator [Vibrio metschnikovii]